MRNNVWIDLVKRIPQDYHNGLVVVTSVGIEISVQNILRVEEEILVIRGRLAGTTETGRLYFIPYDQLNYIGYNREVNEELFKDIYGEPAMFAVPPKPALEEPEAPTLPIAEPPSPPVEESPIPMETSPSGQRKIPSKKALLERLKARNRALGGGPPTGAAPTSTT